MEKADFEAKYMHDWNSAKLYSEKALKAAEGIKILPQPISYWKIPTKERLNIIKAYNNLIIIYDDALLLDPFNLAKGISSLDCWAEQQEENWQTWDINKCRDDYLEAIHILYNNIAENKQRKLEKDNSDSNTMNEPVSIVAQSSNDDPLQIYFDFDKSKLSNLNVREIQKFIFKNTNITKEYIIVGHTDTKGTDKYNQLLSLKRAEAVKSILVKIGIESQNIKVFGKGESDLKIKTKDEIAHPANRRAEISPLN
jgi:OOP family OmpA-OmpF porin